jgi:subtilisin family serine protease
MLTRTRLIALGAVLAAALIALPATASTNDTYRSKQWGLDKIQAEQAWATTNGTGALVAVIDTGVDLGHPDLAANIQGTGKDFVAGDNNAQDENGHGTHVSGIIAAVANNGTGVAGVAPGAKILPVRVLDASGSGNTDDIAAGIRYAADQGAKVMNLSLGMQSGVGEAVKVIGALDPIYSAIDYAYSKGAVVVFAAGNDSVPLCAEPSAHPKVLCVGATDQRDLRSFYSNSDATMSNYYLVAPGGDAITCSGDIFSTWLRSVQQSSCSPQTGYEAEAGTSMAAPHVAGVAALLAAKGLGNQQIMDCIVHNTDDLGTPGRDPVYGWGRVNALKAVTGC